MEVNVNIEKNLELMRGESRFLDIPENGSRIVRFLPTPDEDGFLFFKVLNHFNFKDQDGNGLAIACLDRHGNEATGNECYICKLFDTLKKLAEEHKSAVTKKLSGTGRGSLKANQRFYAQVAEGRKIGDELKYEGPKLLSLPITATRKIGRIMANMQKMGGAQIFEEIAGQSVIISREGSGLQTVYDAERTGIVENLNDILPGWEKKKWDNIWEKIDLKIYGPDTQKTLTQITYPDLDWQVLEKEYGL